jgi:hypothetical protein
MNKPAQIATLSVFGLLVAGSAYVTYIHRPVEPAITKNLREVRSDKRANPAAAAKKLEAIVAENKNSPDPKVQDSVAQARMELGYLKASSGKPEEAREVFLEADKEYKGTGAMSPEYGRLDDQAAYQAIASLNAADKKKEYIAELTKFLKERPLSPLVSGIHTRLVKADPEQRSAYDDLAEIAQQKQDAYSKREMAMCGPRALADLLGRFKKTCPAEAELRKLCKTDDEGTTMENLAAAVSSFGFKVEGLMVNRADFARLKVPSLWLNDTHYVVILAITSTEARVYDPFFKSERSVGLPALNNVDFQATVLEVKP